MRANGVQFQENNFFCELGYCCLLIKDFIKEYCENDIERLVSFSFLDVIGHKKYGDVGKAGGKRKFATAENTKLAKAIYFLLYADKLEKFSVKELFENSKYCSGVLINSFSILFGEDYSFKTLVSVFEGDEYSSFLKKVCSFYHKVNTIGNFVLLPNVQICEDKCFGESREYLDSYLETVKNDVGFVPRYKFVDLLRNKANNEYKKEFIEYANNYIDMAEKMIEKRAVSIISDLKNKLV